MVMHTGQVGGLSAPAGISRRMRVHEALAL